jgi:aspartyl-tRNA(Asn)/glutamyl-tRNA(Gln) amidotransferase subunit B
MRSSAEAVAYARELHRLVTWIGICDGNMQEGSFRCDANVSVRKPGDPLGTRREIKNLNSFKFMQQAIDYEVRWQIEQIEDGLAIEQATVLFDPATGETRAMRTKEDAADYRYFPDPDLPPLVIAQSWIDEVRAAMPELPDAMAKRFETQYGLSAYDAAQLTQSKEMATYFETVTTICARPKIAANWVLGEVSAFMNKAQVPINDVLVPLPTALGELLKKVDQGVLSNNAARTVFQDLVDRVDREIWELAAFIDRMEQSIKDRDLGQMNDSSALEAIIDEVIAANAKSVEEFRQGKDKAFNALVGQIMKASRGKANPAQVNELLRKKLG